ncbi:hypothetical protein RND81_10G196000 [Saponaria officinalis]|uniref:Protein DETOXIFICATION n=1 Tax=Saponaria officinalis TaxID=3572 RepID=A0AAW1I416_SAPOF
METPLIERRDEKEDDWKEGIMEEVKEQAWLAGPLISVNLLLFSLQLISIMFVGHLGKLPLSGASMATSFACVTGFDLLMGMASALDTFCGQSYGAKHYHMLGIHLQRATIILFLSCIPLAIIWANTRSLLIAFSQDPQIATVAGEYAQFLVPGLFAYGILQSLLSFLQTQNIVFPMMISTGVATLLHLPLCWVLVFKSGLGHRGAALATEAFHQLPTFVRLSVPSACMVCLEGWSFELMVLAAGLLPNPTLETSVLSISLDTSATVWMISFSLSGAVSTRVSNELGAGHPRKARLAVSVVLFLAITESIVVGVVLILTRNVWGYAYSNETEVIRYVATMSPILAVSNFLDGIQSVLSGIARGCGWQKIGAYINLGSYYIVGIPVAIVLAFPLHIGGKGLWLGILCALVVQVVSIFIITVRTDWDHEAMKTAKRVNESTIPAEAIA